MLSRRGRPAVGRLLFTALDEGGATSEDNSLLVRLVVAAEDATPLAM